VLALGFVNSLVASSARCAGDRVFMRFVSMMWDLKGMGQ
jgi:hypothetical protein